MTICGNPLDLTPFDSAKVVGKNEGIPLILALYA